MVLPFRSIEKYNINLKGEHELLRKSVRTFAETYLTSRWKEIETRDIIPNDILRQMVKAGFFGIGIPEKYGGQGRGQISKMIVIEELSKIIPSIGVLLDTTDFPILSLLLWGTEEQRKKYLPEIAKGSAAAGAFTEPHAGSWLAGIKTYGEKQGDHYVISGRKIFISTLDYAKYIILLARTSKSPGSSKVHEGMALFLLERDTKGLKIGSKFDTISMRGDRPYELILDNVEVPKDQMIGEEGMGFYYAMILLNFTRINIAAQATGLAQAAFEKAIDYALNREAFGKKIYQFQSIGFRVADMFGRIQASRLLTYWAATLSESQFKEPSNPLPDVALSGSVAKIYATETAELCSRHAVQIYGGLGVDSEAGVERYFRDAIVTTIYEGTNEIQKYIIARFLPQVIYGKKLKMT